MGVKIHLWSNLTYLSMTVNREGTAKPLRAAGPGRASSASGLIPEQGQLMAVWKEGCSRAPAQDHI